MYQTCPKCGHERRPDDDTPAGECPACGLLFAQSTMDVAPYVNDARAGRIVLLGGGTGSDRPGFHDWTNLLGDLGLLHRDHAIAAAVDGAGVVLMLLAFAWGAAALAAQHRNLGRRS